MYIYGGWHSGKMELYNDHWIFDAETKSFLRVENITGDEILKRYYLF